MHKKSVSTALMLFALVGSSAAPSQTVAAQSTSENLRSAKANEIALPNSYRREVTSRSNGVTYKLTVFLPRDYDPKSSERYPVFYFIPGDAFGVYFSQIARFLSSGDIPKLIVVGVDFPSDDSYFKDLPTAGKDPHWDVPQQRGAANFLQIMKTEIKPYIDSHFPTDPSDTGIGGHSLGGFFALYAMFHAPHTFTHIFASSPSLSWQDFILLREEAALAKRSQDLKVRAFVDQGGQEGDDGRLAQLDAAIRSRHYPSLQWYARRTPGQTHQTIAFADAIDAMYAIYGPRLRHPSEAVLKQLTGQWRRSDGHLFRIESRQEHLYLVDFDDDRESVELLSSKPDEWFVRYVWNRFEVERQPGKPLSMVIHLQDTPGPNGEARHSVMTAERVSP